MESTLLEARTIRIYIDSGTIAVAIVLGHNMSSQLASLLPFRKKQYEQKFMVQSQHCKYGITLVHTSKLILFLLNFSEKLQQRLAMGLV